MIVVYVVLGVPKVISALKHPWITMLVVIAGLIVVALFEQGMLDRPIGIVKVYATMGARWLVGKIVKKKGPARGIRTAGRHSRVGSGSGSEIDTLATSMVIRRTSSFSTGDELQ
jgi:hypothetical protein